MRWTAAVLSMAVACGGPGADFFELSPGSSALSVEMQGIGALCDEGADCTPGLACTNLIYSKHPECELPWPRDEKCPSGTSSMLTATAPAGKQITVDDLRFTGSFCVLRCASNADCRHGQRCNPTGVGYCLR